MPTISATPQRRDTVRPYRFLVRDALGVPVPLSGSETLAARIWRSPDGPVLATPTATHYNPAASLIDVVVAPADVGSLAAGTYPFALNVNGGPQDAFTGTIVLTAGPGPGSVSTIFRASVVARRRRMG